MNKFRHGCLVMKLPDSDAAKIPTVLFGTINGTIGVLASLPQEQFKFLERLQVPALPCIISPVWTASRCTHCMLLTATRISCASCCVICVSLTKAARTGWAIAEAWCFQDCLRRVIKGVGGFSHAEWRAFHNEHTEAECRSFVDGDLIEQFLDLKRESMDSIAKVGAPAGPCYRYARPSDPCVGMSRSLA